MSAAQQHAALNPVTMAFPLNSAADLIELNAAILLQQQQQLMQGGGSAAAGEASLSLAAAPPSSLLPHSAAYSQQQQQQHQAQYGQLGRQSSHRHRASQAADSASSFFPLLSPLSAPSYDFSSSPSASQPSSAHVRGSGGSAFQFPQQPSERWTAAAGGGAVPLTAASTLSSPASVQPLLPELPAAAVDSNGRFLHAAGASLSSAAEQAAASQPQPAAPSSSASPLRPFATPLRLRLPLQSASHLSLPTPFSASFLSHFNFSPMSPSSQQRAAASPRPSPPSLLLPLREGAAPLAQLFSPSRFWLSPPSAAGGRKKRSREQLAEAASREQAAAAEQELEAAGEGGEDEEDAEDEEQQPAAARRDAAQLVKGRRNARDSAVESRKKKRKKRGRAAASRQQQQLRVQAAAGGRRKDCGHRADREAAAAEQQADGLLADAGALPSSSSSLGGSAGAASLALTAASLRRGAPPPPPSTPLRSALRPDAPLFSPSEGLGLFQPASDPSSSAAGGLLFSPLHTPQRAQLPSSHSHSHFFSETPSQSPGVSQLHHLFSPVAFHSQLQPHAHSQQPQQQQTPQQSSLGSLTFASPSPFAQLTPATPERRQRHPGAAASPIALLLCSPLPASQQEHASADRGGKGAASAALPAAQPQPTAVSPTRFFCLSSPTRPSEASRAVDDSPRGAKQEGGDQQAAPRLLLTITSAPASPSGLLSPQPSTTTRPSAAPAMTDTGAAGPRYSLLLVSSGRHAAAEAEQSLRTPCKAGGASVTPASASSSSLTSSASSSFSFRPSAGRAAELATEEDRLRPPQHNGVETPLQQPRAASSQALQPATPSTAQQQTQRPAHDLLKRAAAAAESSSGWDDAAASTTPRAVAMLVS